MRWNGLQIWGGLLNRTRDFVRMGLTWFPDDPALKAQLLRYTVAFAVGTKVHVRGDEDMRTELEKILLRACPDTHYTNREVGRSHALRITGQSNHG